MCGPPGGLGGRTLSLVQTGYHGDDQRHAFLTFLQWVKNPVLSLPITGLDETGVDKVAWTWF